MEEAFIGGCCNQPQLAPLLDGTPGAPTALRAYDFVQWPQVLLEGLQASTENIDAAFHDSIRIRTRNARAHTIPPVLIYFILSFLFIWTRIIIFSLVCFSCALPLPPSTCMGGSSTKECGSTTMGYHNNPTHLLLALLYAPLVLVTALSVVPLDARLVV